MVIGEHDIRRNPDVFLHDSLSDGAFLHDPLTNESFALNPTALLIWENLDKCPGIAAMRAILHACHDDIPENAGAEISGFIEQLVTRGLATTLRRMPSSNGSLS